MLSRIQRKPQAQVMAAASGGTRPPMNKAMAVLAAYRPRISTAAERQKTNISKLSLEQQFVMACAMDNTDRMLRKAGFKVTAGMANSVGTMTSGLAGHAARFISLISANISKSWRKKAW